MECSFRIAKQHLCCKKRLVHQKRSWTHVWQTLMRWLLVRAVKGRRTSLSSHCAVLILIQSFSRDRQQITSSIRNLPRNSSTTNRKSTTGALTWTFDLHWKTCLHLEKASCTALGLIYLFEHVHFDKGSLWRGGDLLLLDSRCWAEVTPPP